MSTHAAPSQPAQKRLTAPDIRARKSGVPIVMLTSYHAHTARILDAHCDVILVGDSLGMVMHGLETTIPVTLDMMILQGHAVMRGSKRALVVVDLPFGSYEGSKDQTFMAAARPIGPRPRPTPARSRRRARSRWCLKRWRSRWPPRSPARSRSPPSASGR